MTKRISRISILRAGVVSASVYTFMTLMYLCFYTLYSFVKGGGEGSILEGLYMVVAACIAFPIIGFISGIAVAIAYNMTANMFGGIEIVLEDVDGAPAAAHCSNDDLAPEGQPQEIQY